MTFAPLAPPAPAPSAAGARGLPAWLLLPLAALAWWAVGFLPWLVAGLAGTAGGTWAALPLRTASLTQLVIGALLGGLVAGLLCLMAEPGRRGLAVLATGGGVGLAVLVTVVQSVTALDGAGGFDSDGRVVSGLAVGTVLLALTGWGLGAVSAAGPAGAAPALAVLSAVLPGWTWSLFLGAGYAAGVGATTWIDLLTRWLGAAVLAVSLLLAGARPLSRLAWWPLLVLLAWSVGPLLTAIGYLQPLLRSGAGLPNSLLDSLAGAAQVFGLAYSPANRDLLPWVVAVVVALLVAVVLGSVRANRAEEPAAAPPP
ncbi:hypothetical protein [Blastococcus sp. SYSU D00820]